jgi:ribonuclease HII
MDLSEIICGVDEAGRGPLAGPVCAAAVILQAKPKIRGLNDSKQLTEAERDAFAVKIKARAVTWAVGWASVEEIDQLNIRQANFLAMRRAVEALSVLPTIALVDGNDPPPLPCPVKTIVGGDALEACISAASILAKTARDALMKEMDALYPGYGFAGHKGYSTPQHYAALDTLGPCAIHRRSFAPVRERLGLAAAE